MLPRTIALTYRSFNTGGKGSGSAQLSPREMRSAAASAQYLQGLLQALQLCLAPCRAVLVGLGFCDAHVLELRQVLNNCVELGLGCRTIGGRFCDRLVQLRSLFGLILDILSLCHCRLLVVLRGHLVLGLRRVLSGGGLGKALGEIGEAYLQHPNDTTSGS